MSGPQAPAVGHFVKIHLEIDGGGALTPQLLANVDKACNRAEEEGNAVLVVDVRGGPGHEGASSWWRNLSGIDIQLVNQWEQALRRIERLAAVTIATVCGSCGGTALEILLTTDYRLATRDFRICLRGPSGEIWPGMHLFRLAHQIGIGRSRQIVLFGAELSATRAVELGLADDIAEDLDGAVSSFVGSLGQEVDKDLAVRRRLLLDAVGMTFEDALGAHLAACDRMKRRTRQATIDGGEAAKLRRG